MSKVFIGILAVVLYFNFIISPVSACTLFGASGSEWVDDGGTIVVKNRDWTPQYQEMKLIKAKENNYAYYGIFSGDNKEKLYLKGGVNEAGLAVFSATVGTIPKAERLKMDRYKGSMSTLLKKCKSVDEALALNEVFVGPQYLVMADKDKIAYVEIAPEGNYAIRQTNNGALYHTNHYVTEELEWANYREPRASSLTRYQRIDELLNNSSKPYSLDDIIKFSNDKNAGLDNSIWRMGSKPNITQTLGVMAVHFHPEGKFDIYTKIRRNPDEQGKENILILKSKDIFN